MSQSVVAEGLAPVLKESSSTEIFVNSTVRLAHTKPAGWCPSGSGALGDTACGSATDVEVGGGDVIGSSRHDQ
jgi:hypothetical protein